MNQNKDENSNSRLRIIISMTDQRQPSVQLPILKYFFLNFLGFTLPLYPSFFLVAYYFPLVDLIINHDSWWFWASLFFPLYLLGAILLWIFLVIEYAALVTRIWRKKSMPIEGVFHRTFSKGNVEDERLKFYHDRGYIIKFPVWLAAKSPFPWLLHRALTRIGYGNKIGKDVTFMDTIPGLEFTTLKDGAVYYPGSATASHVVDSIFGNLTIKKIVIEERASVFPHTIIGPGVNLEEGASLLPRSAGIKDWESKKPKKFYTGSPGRAIKEYEGVFSQLPPMLEERYKKQGYLLGTEIDRYNDENFN